MEIPSYSQHMSHTVNFVYAFKGETHFVGAEPFSTRLFDYYLSPFKKGIAI